MTEILRIGSWITSGLLLVSLLTATGTAHSVMDSLGDGYNKADEWLQQQQ